MTRFADQHTGPGRYIPAERRIEMKKYYDLKIAIIDVVYDWVFRFVDRLEASRRKALEAWHTL
jgi:hypothetical protein